ncbi:MAG: protein kinase [Ignavibacteria bacterium]|nr:protein kinase [Ignavibacteria bacterium]
MNGKTLLHYEILEKLGEGGMGIVYLAEDTRLKRKVAIKFLPASLSAREEDRKRFEIEAQAAASINHPNIAHIYAFEETDNEIFIVMEFIEGIELKEKIKSSLLSNEDIKSISLQIAGGLEFAHKKGIVHRDIKSSNIMITNDNNIKIMDFGLAKINGGTEVTKTGSTLGTVAYMSPEQTRGVEVDHRTDIWSFGVVLYEMLTGELPFKGSYDQAIIYSILNEEPEPFETNENDQTIKKIIQRALQKNRDERYLSVAETISDLESGNVSEDVLINKDEIKEIKRLAVLPFSNIAEDPKTNFLSFALADQIIGSMAYSKSVLVRPSSTIRKYQNEIVDLQKAGSELNVHFVLAGNYLKEDDTIRLNIELVDLESEDIIWRESIQIKYKNAFELQDIVSQKVVDGLKVQFSDEERERMKPETPQNPAAYEFYLKAVSYPYTVEGNRIAIEMLNNSVKLDSNYAHTYLELGIRNHLMSQVGEGTRQAHDIAVKSMLKALELKSDLLPALANLALFYTDVGRHEEAHELLMRALEINPNDAWLHFSLSYHYRYVGFLEESKKEAEIALAIDPNNPRFRSSVITRMFLGEYDEILETFNLDMDSPFTLNHLGEVAFRAGKYELAKKYLMGTINIENEIGEFYFASSIVEIINGNKEKAAEYNLKRELENPSDSENLYEIARIFGLLNKTDACARALRKSINLGYISYPSMQRDYFLDAVRNEPEIKELITKAKKKHEELKEKLDTTY